MGAPDLRVAEQRLSRNEELPQQPEGKRAGGRTKVPGVPCARSGSVSRTRLIAQASARVRKEGLRAETASAVAAIHRFRCAA